MILKQRIEALKSKDEAKYVELIKKEEAIYNEMMMRVS